MNNMGLQVEALPERAGSAGDGGLRPRGHAESVGAHSLGWSSHSNRIALRHPAHEPE